MSSRNRRVYCGKLAFDVPPEVYEPAEDTSLVFRNLIVKEGMNVLDMGTGCGVLAVLAAERGARVVAVDVNPHAVTCARSNAELNGFERKVDVRLGDLFEAVSETEKFDLIVFNAPYLPVERNEGASWIEKAWAGGPSGRVVIDRFIDQAPGHLEDEGRILLVQSSFTGVKETLERLGQLALHGVVIGEEWYGFERIVLVEARKRVNEFGRSTEVRTRVR